MFDDVFVHGVKDELVHLGLPERGEGLLELGVQGGGDVGGQADGRHEHILPA